ncbi:MAG TPA: methyltransferase domain-containing protein [Gammaproteobacteria bacterium]
MRCGNPVQTRKLLRDWYRRQPGDWLAEREVELLDEVLPTLFGYHLLQVGVSYPGDCLAKSKIPHQMVMDVDEPPCLDDSRESLVHRKIAYLRGIPEQLPFAADSLDVLLLSHTLEFTSEPHQVLREVDRALIPEGHAVILGFNPWGWWMWWRLILGWRGKPPWCGRFIPVSRLKDWLQLLGFDIVAHHSYFYRPPFSSKRLLQKLKFMERFGRRFWPFFCGAYLLVARKRVATLTPIRPRWRPRRSRLVAPELAGNSSSVSNRDNGDCDK